MVINISLSILICCISFFLGFFWRRRKERKLQKRITELELNMIEDRQEINNLRKVLLSKLEKLPDREKANFRYESY